MGVIAPGGKKMDLVDKLIVIPTDAWTGP